MPDYSGVVVDQRAVVSAVGQVKVATSEHRYFSSDSVLLGPHGDSGMSWASVGITLACLTAKGAGGSAVPLRHHLGRPRPDDSAGHRESGGMWWLT